jgi:hypothetical protein
MASTLFSLTSLCLVLGSNAPALLALVGCAGP